jgi:ribonuclease Z
VDAGEGLTLALGTSVFAPSLVAITHGHSDHLLGLPGFAGARRFGKGAQEKPWAVLFPAGSAGVEAIQQMIAGLWRGIEFPITWRAIGPGDTHRLSATRRLEAFAVTHVPSEPCIGYRAVETRRRLRREYAHLAQSEVEHMARGNGRDSVMEQYDHVLFAHSGDAMPVTTSLVEGADLLVHDATFLRSGDRREPIHAASEEVFALAREAGVAALVLHHLSIRYPRPEAYDTLRTQRLAAGFSGACWVLDEGAFVDLT